MAETGSRTTTCTPWKSTPSAIRARAWLATFPQSGRPPLMMRTGHEELRVAGHQMPSLDATAWPPISRIVAGSPTTTSRSVARDIPTYSRSRARSLTRRLVEAQHDGAPLETLAAQHVTVEDVVAVPEGLASTPSWPWTSVRSSCTGWRWPVVSSAMLLGLPALVEQRVDLVVGRVERVLGRRGDEADRRAVASAGVHPAGRERTEASWICLVLRRLWSSTSGTSGTGGRPKRAKIRWFSSE